MKNLIQIFFTAIICGFLLCIPGAIPAFKHQTFLDGIIILIFTGITSLLGPFAAMLYGIPMQIGSFLDFQILIIFGLLFVILLVLYFFQRNMILTFIQTTVLIWVAFGAYYSSLGALNSI